MNLENIVLSKRVQTQDITYSTITFIWIVQNRPIDIERRWISGGWGRRGGRKGKWLLTVMGFLFGVRRMFCVRGDQCTTLWIYKNHWITHIKGVTFMVCELCCKKAVIKKKPPPISSEYFLLWILEFNKTSNSLDYVRCLWTNFDAFICLILIF